MSKEEKQARGNIKERKRKKTRTSSCKMGNGLYTLFFLQNTKTKEKKGRESLMHLLWIYGKRALFSGWQTHVVINREAIQSSRIMEMMKRRTIYNGLTFQTPPLGLPLFFHAHGHFSLHLIKPELPPPLSESDSKWEVGEAAQFK